jgi:putative sterol carrier protein
VAGKTDQKYSVRTFLDGDEAALVKLFEKAYMNYGGYSKKTPECWRWNCLQRPDMERTGVIVALDNNTKEIVGYVVAGKSGYVWELSYDPECDGVEVVSLLLDKATAYIEAAGASSVNFNAPQKDAVIKRVCQKRGFVASEPPKMFLSVLSIQNLVLSLAYDKVSELAKKYDETVLIKIDDAPFWLDATIYVHINQLGVNVENEAQAHTAQLQTDYTTFSSILFGNMSPFSAFAHAKLRIKPLSKILTILKLLSNLQVKAEWFYPLSDYG